MQSCVRCFLVAGAGLLAAHALALPARAATVVTEPVRANTTWTRAGSPYIVQGAIPVFTPATLTIEPGVVVKFATTLSGLNVSGGRLLAHGTASERITFTSLADDSIAGDTGNDGATSGAPGQWRRLYFSTGGSSLDYADIRFGGYDCCGPSHGYGVVTFSAPATTTINHARIYENVNAGIKANGTGNGEYAATISNTEIMRNTHGISVLQSGVRLDHVFITDNTEKGIFFMLSPGSYARTVVTSSDIENNGRDGIYFHVWNVYPAIEQLPIGHGNNIAGNGALYGPEGFRHNLFLVSVYKDTIARADWSNNYWGAVWPESLYCPRADPNRVHPYHIAYFWEVFAQGLDVPEGPVDIMSWGWDSNKCYTDVVKTDPPAISPFNNRGEPVMSDRVLAERFQPQLIFDGGERWRPLDIGEFFTSEATGGDRDEPNGIEVCLPLATACDPLDTDLHFQKNASNPYYVGGDPGVYLLFDADNESTIEVCHSGIVVDCNGGSPETNRHTAIYYHTVTSSSVYYKFIDYWFFYRFNNWYLTPGFDHQGDWEGLFVMVPKEDPNPETFILAGLDAHGHSFVYLPEVLRCGGMTWVACGPHESRVNGYVADGSHATYPWDCDGPCIQTNSLLDEQPFGGDVPWGRNNDPAGLKEFPTESEAGGSWIDFWGHWGQAPEAPEGPSQKTTRFREPWNVLICTNRFGTPFNNGGPCSIPGPQMARMRAAEVRGCNAWNGPFVAATLCDQERLDRALRAGELDGPPGASIVAKGLRSGAAPGIAQAVGEPLRPGTKLVIRGAVSPKALIMVKARISGRLVMATFTGAQVTRRGRTVLELVAGREGGSFLRLVNQAGRVAYPVASVRD